MSVNGVLQLKKLKVFYSNWGGSSDETRYGTGLNLMADFFALC